MQSVIEKRGVQENAALGHVGITEGLVRLSVGCEDRDDLLADLEQALDQAEVQTTQLA